MCSVGILVLASLFAVTESLVSLTADKYAVKDGESVVLTCTVPNFTDNIYVIQGTSNRALCIASSTCIPTDSLLYTSTKSGSTIVTFTIISFSKGRDVGSWICRYGSVPDDSAPVTLSEFTASSSGSGGGSTDLKWWYILLIVLGVLLFIIAIIFCCIFNTRCKFGDRCTDLPLSFTFPSGNGSKVNITSIGHIGTPFPKSEPDKKEVTPQGSHENPTPKIKTVDKKVTPHTEILLFNELNIAKSTIASTPPRSGAKQQLYPLIKGEGGNGNGEDLPR